MSGSTNLLASWEEQEEETRGAFRVTRISVGGDPHVRAILDAVVDRYNAVSGRERPSAEDLQALIGQKVTLVRTGENMFGSGILNAQEGKLFESSRGLGILPKGARSKGFVVNPEKVLDVFPGYDAAGPSEMVRKVRDHFPILQPLTQERFNELPAESSTLSLCMFGSYRMPDSTAAGSIYLATNYLREDDIIEGVLLIRPEHGVSEHGSVWGQQLLRSSFGEVVGFEPISFAEGLELCNLDFDFAYECLLGGKPVVAE